jgi:alpha-ribazole phosphatase
MKLTAVRHTSVNVPIGVCYGFSDVPLNPSFEAEAANIRRQLQESNYDKIYSSPLSRCVLLADYCGFPDAELDPRIKEYNFGDWEMNTWSEINPSEAQAWMKDWLNYPSKNGESFRMMQERVGSFLDEIKMKNDQMVCLFTHSGVIRLIHIYLGLCSIEELFEFPVEYGQVFYFDL